MNRIISKKKLSEEVFMMKVEAPLIAEEHKPGQFVILHLGHELGERIPLTIVDSDTNAGTITLIFQVVGKTTYKLSAINEGEQIVNVVGPLGNPTYIEKFGTVVCVGGGIGVAPMYPIAKGMKAAGNTVVVVMGARTKELLILENEMRSIADEIVVCTDDGTYGRKCLVTEPLKEICERDPKPDLVVAIGPAIMMKFCAQTTRPYGIRTVVSLNTIMIDGTGMCGGCRITVGGKTKFVCVDGPEFDGHQVDFDNMMNRLSAYKEQEKRAYEKCRLELTSEKKQKN